MIRVSVPGKIHFMGEHAVVYGMPALLAAINKRLVVSVEASSVMRVDSQESPAFVLYAVEQVQKYCHLQKMPPMHITIQSEIPAGFHLGSSAATAVGTVAAVLYHIKKIWNPEVINHIAYEVEKKQHGNPSGGDNTIVTMGGMLWFRKELEFLKSMWQFTIPMPALLNHFFLINTEKPQETTGDMVRLVRKRYDKNPSSMQRVFLNNEAQVKNIAIAMKEQNEPLLIHAIQEGEKTLEQMGVVSKKVMPCIRAIVHQGGAAKVLGGGGKTAGVGYLLCYHNNRDVVTRIAHRFHFPIEPVTIGGDGVTLLQKE